MNEHDENSPPPEPLGNSTQPASDIAPELLPATPQVPAAGAAVPEDLRTPWSWRYLIVFIAFGLASLIALEAVFEVFVMVRYGLNVVELQKLATTSAPYVTARQTVWFGLLMLFLYLLIRVYKGMPFWRTIGWRKLHPRSMTPGAAALGYLLGGSLMAVVIGLASRLVHTKGKLPIEQLFQNQRGALLIMVLALLGAPLVEETVFRGYIYPVLARSFGVPLGVLATGALFGLLHAPQLWGAWGIVALLITVGVVLTYVRARTGTVLASFLLHLGYNGMLFLAAAISTGGFRHLPQGS